MMYVMDASKATGTLGRYPEPIARMICRILNWHERRKPLGVSRAFWDYAPRPEGY